MKNKKLKIELISNTGKIIETEIPPTNNMEEFKSLVRIRAKEMIKRFKNDKQKINV